MSIYKILFPNPYGYKLPNESEVRALQKQYGFSEEYADFLLTQNGFNANPFGGCDDAEHLIPSESHWLMDIHTDLIYLYGLRNI